MPIRGRSGLLALAAALALAGGCQRSAKYEAGADTETDCGAGGFGTSLVTGLTWETSPACDPMTCAAAIDRCAALAEGGFDDWRLPTIGELRTFVAGCDPIEAGGACGVTDGCAELACWDPICYGGCGVLAGPGDEGCYWPEPNGGVCAPYWSAPIWNSAGTDSCWYVSFDGGFLNYVNADEQLYARCVRGGE